jgi:hypothetical protein
VSIKKVGHKNLNQIVNGQILSFYSCWMESCTNKITNLVTNCSHCIFDSDIYNFKLFLMWRFSNLSFYSPRYKWWGPNLLFYNIYRFKWHFSSVSFYLCWMICLIFNANKMTSLKHIRFFKMRAIPSRHSLKKCKSNYRISWV